MTDRRSAISVDQTLAIPLRQRLRYYEHAVPVAICWVERGVPCELIVTGDQLQPWRVVTRDMELAELARTSLAK